MLGRIDPILHYFTRLRLSKVDQGLHHEERDIGLLNIFAPIVAVVRLGSTIAISDPDSEIAEGI